MTAKNGSNNWYLMCTGFEIYGAVLGLGQESKPTNSCISYLRGLLKSKFNQQGIYNHELTKNTKFKAINKRSN